MASLIVCTPGGKDDNCYVTAVQATAYFANTLRAQSWDARVVTLQPQSWDALAVTLREQALIQATQDLEALGGATLNVRSPARSRFAGFPYNCDLDVQALHFPRITDVDHDGVTKLVPQDIKAAVCEQAAWLLAKLSGPDLVDRDALQAAGVTNISVDGLSESYGPRTVPAGICPAAWTRVQPFLRGGWSGTV